MIYSFIRPRILPHTPCAPHPASIPQKKRKMKEDPIRQLSANRKRPPYAFMRLTCKSSLLGSRISLCAYYETVLCGLQLVPGLNTPDSCVVWTVSMPIEDMQSYSPVASPGASKDFYVDNLLRGPASLARPVPLSPAVFLKSADDPPVKRSTENLKFGVNAILALDSREKTVATKDIYNPSKYNFWISPATF